MRFVCTAALAAMFIVTPASAATLITYEPGTFSVVNGVVLAGEYTAGYANDVVDETLKTTMGFVANQRQVRFKIAFDLLGEANVCWLACQTLGVANDVTRYSFDDGAFGLTVFANSPVTLDNILVETVPEPASWALMIGGFALAGSAIRRRRYSVAPIYSLA